MNTVYQMDIKHLAYMFDGSLCGLKKLQGSELTYDLHKTTCLDCLEKAVEEKIESDKAIDLVPHCPHCGELPKYVTLTFVATKLFQFDIQTERQNGKIVPLIYGTDVDTLDTEMQPEEKWQLTCENDHKWFTRKIDPLDDGDQWVLVDKEDENDPEIPGNSICPVCWCDRSEHNWEVHTAEMRANQ
jgi:hypothetical protein